MSRIWIIRDVNEGDSILEVARKRIPPTWNPLLNIAVPELANIGRLLVEKEQLEGRSYPLRRDLFNAYRFCHLNNVKVVIVGQDPYHSDNSYGLPTTVGMSFSVRGTDKVPPSLRVIYSELARNGYQVPNHGDLTGWCTQGVLLLNSCLTVRPGCPGSHICTGNISMWSGFIDKTFSCINDVNPHCVVMLWGGKAQSIKKTLSRYKFHILECGHPSPLNTGKNGFVGSDIFVNCNEELTRQRKNIIDWGHLPINNILLYDQQEEINRRG